MKSATLENWTRLWRETNAKTDPLPVFDELAILYSEPHRHYHNLRHIDDCLTEFASVRHLASQPAAVELAIWFHDAIYDPRASDNEEKSAEFAKQRISQAGTNPNLVAPVFALVMATKAHDATLHPDAPLLVDVDLSILGQSENRFEEYETKIRKEYEWVPQVVFSEKRAEILERFLARSRIYSTDAVFQKYEQPARKNLIHSLHNLRVSK